VGGYLSIGENGNQKQGADSRRLRLLEESKPNSPASKAQVPPVLGKVTKGEVSYKMKRGTNGPDEELLGGIATQQREKDTKKSEDLAARIAEKTFLNTP